MMVKTVRVLFWDSSISNRSTSAEATQVMQQLSSETRYFINGEWRRSEALLRSCLGTLFGESIECLDIISAVLALRTNEGLCALHDKLVIIMDPDFQQMTRLVREYSFPTGCTETKVLFFSSNIDAEMNFSMTMLRDTSKAQENETQA